jgi:cytochrome d ubiquinol oxidase subunit II
MLDFSPYMNLPLVWGVILALVVLLYVLLDGFSLGIGILFPFSPTDECRDKMMNSIAPFWDGNETWLVMGGGGLFAAFPLAYSVLLPALYVPVLLMLIALIFRGVSFEFRFKSSGKMRRFWDLSFHFGSLFATLLQGMILGGIVQGIEVEGKSFIGSGFDWLSGFSVMTGISLVAGYILLGSSWLYMKTTRYTQEWAANTVEYILLHLLIFASIVCVWMPFIDQEIYDRWFSFPNIAYLIFLPIGLFASFYFIYYGIEHKKEHYPFFFAIAIFVLGFIGVLINTFPYVVPRAITFAEAAAAPESLSLMLVAVAIVLPLILFYTAYSYYVFRGKAKAEDMYSHD